MDTISLQGGKAASAGLTAFQLPLPTHLCLRGTDKTSPRNLISRETSGSGATGPCPLGSPHTFQYTAMVKPLSHKALEEVTITFQSYHELPALQ